MGKFINKNFSSFQIISWGFALVILTGGLLLTLPFATQDGLGASFADGLFTATSAVCVTGLVLHDTATYWTGFGQTVIICLIQIGGMGVVTVAIAIAVASHRKIGLRERSTMAEAISAPQVGGIVRLTGFILKTTFTIELCGALLMLPVFWQRFGALKGIWYAVFHAISAFCNAGFDLMGVEEPYSSLMHFASNPIINSAIMLLIISGGIGFLTWEDIKTKKLRIHQYRMQSKVILSVTGTIILLPAVYFFFCEFQDMPLGQRFWCSMFQSVTPRTAGFNTADQTALSGTGVAITILLMLIGGSPGSTAGGMKTTTLAVMLATALAVFRRRDDAHFFGRRVAMETVRNAAAILLMYVVLFLAGGMIISGTEGLPLYQCLFETASAIGTVGLSMGITASLGMLSRCILIFLMFFGRVGGLTLIFATVSSGRNYAARLPQEKITVG